MPGNEGEGRAALAEADALQRGELVETGGDQDRAERDRREGGALCGGKARGNGTADLDGAIGDEAGRRPCEEVS
jgi:hypothetical protein